MNSNSNNNSNNVSNAMENVRTPKLAQALIKAESVARDVCMESQRVEEQYELELSKEMGEFVLRYQAMTDALLQIMTAVMECDLHDIPDDEL